jgi:hypothetical protein
MIRRTLRNAGVRNFDATRKSTGEAIHPMCGSMEIWISAPRGANNSPGLADRGDRMAAWPRQDKPDERSKPRASCYDGQENARNAQQYGK